MHRVKLIEKHVISIHSSCECSKKLRDLCVFLLISKLLSLVAINEDHQFAVYGTSFCPKILMLRAIIYSPNFPFLLFWWYREALESTCPTHDCKCGPMISLTVRKNYQHEIIIIILGKQIRIFNTHNSYPMTIQLLETKVN